MKLLCKQQSLAKTYSPALCPSLEPFPGRRLWPEPKIHRPLFEIPGHHLQALMSSLLLVTQNLSALGTLTLSDPQSSQRLWAYSA
jgi:hypothetical protein